MANTAEKLGSMIEEHLGISDQSALDADVASLGVNSMDAVNFLKVVNQEFSTSISPEQASELTSLRGLVNLIDG